MTLPLFLNAQGKVNELPPSFFGNWVEDLAQCEIASVLSIADSEEGLIVSGLDWYSSEVEVKNKGDFYTLLIKATSEDGEFDTEINIKMGEEGSLIYFYPESEEMKLIPCNPDGEVQIVAVQMDEMEEVALEDEEQEVGEFDVVGVIDLEAAVLDLPSDYYGYWVEVIAQCEVAPILSIVDSGDGLTVSSLDWSSNVVEVKNKGDFYNLVIKGVSEEGDFETEINIKMGEAGNLIYFYPGLEETPLVKCDFGDNFEFVEVEEMDGELELEELDGVDTVSVENIDVELLQGTWQSIEDESSFLIFEGDHLKSVYKGMEEDMEDDVFILSDACMNESDGGNDFPKEKNRYISSPNMDMCWYIEVLDASNLSLIYLSRGNQLTYRRVE